jgi:hypothetical protein
MSRPYSPSFKKLITNDKSHKLGIDLGRTCMRANLPATYVAEVFDTTRMTIHSWFRGGVIRSSKRRKIEVFIELLEEDINKGDLPAKTLKEARTYVEDMIGRPIK